MSNFLPDNDDDINDNNNDDDEKTDRVVDICDYVIETCWKTIFENEDEKPIDLSKLEIVLRLAGQAHMLLLEVIAPINPDSDDDSDNNENYKW